MPSRARCSVNRIEVYWLPASEWWSSWPALDRVALPVAVPQRDPQRGQHQVGALVVAACQPTIRWAKHVDDERDVDEPGPGPAVGEVRDPDAVWVPVR